MTRHRAKLPAPANPGDRTSPAKGRAARATSSSNGAFARGVAVSLAVGKLACVPAEPPSNPQPAPVHTAAPAATSSAVEVAPVATVEPVAPPPHDPSDVLAGYKVTDKDYARRTLFTWTSDGQIAELLKTRVLLSRTESPTNGRSFYDRKIEERWMAGDKLAALLRAPAFQKARFAWPAAWATVLGWPGESYGGQLVQVTLKEDAWIVLLRTSTPAWEARDMSGNVVPIDQVMKRPDRIAAVHFVHDAVAPPPSGAAIARVSSPDGRDAYREYVLCNESMIASWAVGTDQVASEIAAGADLAEAAAKFFEAHPPPVQRVDRWNAHLALLVWPGLVEAAAAKELYESAIAFPSSNYVIEPAQLRILAAALRGLTQHGAATVHKPTSVFPGARPVPVPPPPPVPPTPPRRKYYGTFY